jgi:hypothetical protein
MDPFSITVGCVGLLQAIAAVTTTITGFVQEVRSARSDMDGVSREILSVKTVLGLLEQDVANNADMTFPENLRKQITGILTNCTAVIMDIQASLHKHEGNRLQKAAHWVLSGKDDMTKLRTSLEAHKSALDIALDMIQM